MINTIHVLLQFHLCNETFIKVLTIHFTGDILQVKYLTFLKNYCAILLFTFRILIYLQLCSVTYLKKAVFSVLVYYSLPYQRKHSQIAFRLLVPTFSTAYKQTANKIISASPICSQMINSIHIKRSGNATGGNSQIFHCSTPLSCPELKHRSGGNPARGLCSLSRLQSPSGNSKSKKKLC